MEDRHNGKSQSLGLHLYDDPVVSNALDEFKQATGITLEISGSMHVSPDDFKARGCRPPPCHWFMAASPQARQSCLRGHDKLREDALKNGKASRMQCGCGLEHVAVPVFSQDKPVEFLLIGGLTRNADQMGNIMLFVIKLMGQAASQPESDLLNSPKQAMAMPAPLVRAVRFAEQHYDDPELTSASVASRAGVTPQRMAQLFRGFFGITYSEWLARKRVMAAMRLLRNSPMLILDVALAAGFGSISSFNRVFHKQTGITPHEYRDGKEPHKMVNTMRPP